MGQQPQQKSASQLQSGDAIYYARTQLDGHHAGFALPLEGTVKSVEKVGENIKITLHLSAGTITVPPFTRFWLAEPRDASINPFPIRIGPRRETVRGVSIN